jgi:non-specific serine/threonine protein kinase/serine/threonine-protein kinase
VDADRFARIKAIIVDARELEGEAREAWLDRACAGDSALRAEVESLLTHAQGPPPILETGGLQRTVDAALDPGLPAQVGPYTLGAVLGEGGMGVVFRAEQTAPIRRAVALKVVRRGMDTDRIIARFALERQTLAMMSHPNIAQIFDAGATADGRPFFAMELVDGLPITGYADARGLGLDARVALFRDVCQGVRHAHQKGIIHRDLKPSNILVAEHNGRPVPKIIDFGISKVMDDAAEELTGGARGLGTPASMSPEQAGVIEAPVDTRTDVYALGVLLYQLLAGQPPWVLESGTPAELHRLMKETTVRRPSDVRPGVPAIAPGDLAGDLDSVVLKALEIDPDRRYASVEQLHDDLERHRLKLPVEARPATWAYRTGRFVRRHRLAVGTAATVVLALTVGLGSAVVSLQAARRERDAAQEARGIAQRERDAAQEARGVADATSQFLVRMLQAANPLASSTSRADVKVRDALDHAVGGIASAFKDRPAVEALVRFEIAQTYAVLDLSEAACEQYAQSADAGRRAFGPMDKRTLTAAANSARCHQIAGRFERSAAIIEPLSVACASGPPLPACEPVYDTEGRIASNRGGYTAAETAFRRAIAVGSKNPDDPAQIQRTWELAVAIAGQSDRGDEAEGLYGAALERAARLFGPDDERTLRIRQSLANLYFDTNRASVAVPIYEAIVETRTRRFGANNNAVQIARNNLANALCRTGELARCLELIREVVEAKTRALGAAHPSTLLARMDHGSALAANGRLNEAIVVTRAAVAAAGAALPEDHVNRGLFALDLAERLGQAGRWRDAEPHAIDAHTRLLRLRGADSRDTRRSAGLLADIYDHLKQPAAAVEWRKKAGA